MKVLFIDDEPLLLKEYVKALEAAGFEVEFRVESEDAMQFFLSNHDKLDAVILDVMMPPPAVLGDRATEYGLRTGISLLARIREENSTIPVILFTNLMLSRIDIAIDDCLDIRQKMETPPFVLPKLLQKLIIRAEKTMKRKDEKEQISSSHVEFHGDIHAEQLYVGDHGRQTQKKTLNIEVVVDDFCNELGHLTKAQQLPSKIEVVALDHLDAVRTILKKPNADRIEVANVVSRFTKIAPWAEAKFGELLTGAAGSMLGTGIIQGIKFALGL
jgi:CheY-like chemotaxis protein